MRDFVCEHVAIRNTEMPANFAVGAHPSPQARPLSPRGYARKWLLVASAPPSGSVMSSCEHHGTTAHPEAAAPSPSDRRCGEEGGASGHDQCSSPEEALRNILPPFSSICPADLRSSIHSLASSCPSVRPSLDVAAASGATRWQAGGRSEASSRRADSGNRCRTGGAD